MFRRAFPCGALLGALILAGCDGVVPTSSPSTGGKSSAEPPKTPPARTGDRTGGAAKTNVPDIRD
jgi:hypothetical protein